MSRIGVNPMFRKYLCAAIAIGMGATMSHGAFGITATNNLGRDCEKYDRQGWLTIFNGDSTWSENFIWISTQTGHGSSGGRWWVAPDPDLVTAGKIKPGQNILWSMQNAGGNGGVIMSKRKYANYETMIGVFPGWENDGGLFHRTTPNGQAYQMMIDYRGGGTVGGLWPEGIDAGRSSQDVYNLNTETSVRVGPLTGNNGGGAFMNWPVTDWAKIWDPDGFNTMFGRIIGPVTGGKIKAWGWLGDSNHTVSNFEATARAAGHIGLQIHAGAGSWKGGPNKYTFWKVRELDSLAATPKPVCPEQPTIAAYGVDYIVPVNGLVKCADLASGSCTGTIQGLKGTTKILTQKGFVDLRLKWQGGQDLGVFADVNGAYTLTVFDGAGKVVGTRNGSGQVSHLFPGLSKGSYFVNLATATGTHTAKAARF